MREIRELRLMDEGCYVHTTTPVFLRLIVFGRKETVLANYEIEKYAAIWVRWDELGRNGACECK